MFVVEMKYILLNKFYTESVVMKFLIEVEKISDCIHESTINDTIKKECLSENEKTFLDISLVEYKELRTELRDVMSRQNTILLSSIAQFATLIGLALTIFSSDTASNKENLVASILCLLIPIVTMLLGIIWIDLTYRQINMASYIYQIEKQAIEMLHLSTGEHLSRTVLFWEHHIHNLEEKRLFKGGNIWSYLCSLSLYVLATIGSFVLGWLLIGWKLWYIIAIIFFFAYALFIYVYIVNIYDTYKNKQ